MDHAGANLILGKGRHCEIAVVAAASPPGLLAAEVVPLRRHYAVHLGVSHSGTTQDSDEPIHIENAIENYKGRHGAPENRIVNLGRARATFSGGRYAIRWP
jgi:hypothetical protein